MCLAKAFHSGELCWGCDKGVQGERRTASGINSELVCVAMVMDMLTIKKHNVCRRYWDFWQRNLCKVENLERWRCDEIYVDNMKVVREEDGEDRRRGRQLICCGSLKGTAKKKDDRMILSVRPWSLKLIIQTNK